MNKNTRSFGIELQNKFLFLNKPNNIKIIKNRKEIEDSIKMSKKSQISQNNISKRSTMFMKISHNPLKHIQNNGKENNNNLFVIK